MNQIATILLFSWIAGLTAFFGGVIAFFERTSKSTLKDEFTHGIVAFGGGILLAAVSFSLAPEGMKQLSPLLLSIMVLSGGALFCGLDAYLSKQSGNKAQFLAMLMDFIPEALALGALFTRNEKAAILLALFIGAQNLPEGFNSFREIISDKISKRSAIFSLLAISFLGPVSASMGYYILQDSPTLTASIMSFAAGGILYLVFQDIAPKSTMKNHWIPPLGAVAGFLVGMLGQQLLG